MGAQRVPLLAGQVKINCTRYDVELARAWERSRLTAKAAELTKDAGKAEERLAGQRAAARTAGLRTLTRRRLRGTLAQSVLRSDRTG